MWTWPPPSWTFIDGRVAGFSHSCPDDHWPLVPPCWSFCSTWSSEKLPTFWLGGYSLNVAMNLPDDLLRRHEQEGAVDSPLCITDADVVGHLERIGTQVEDLGQAQRHERFLPDVEAFGSLFLRRRSSSCRNAARPASRRH